MNKVTTSGPMEPEALPQRPGRRVLPAGLHPRRRSCLGGTGPSAPTGFLLLPSGPLVVPAAGGSSEHKRQSEQHGAVNHRNLLPGRWLTALSGHVRGPSGLGSGTRGRLQWGQAPDGWAAGRRGGGIT